MVEVLVSIFILSIMTLGIATSLNHTRRLSQKIKVRQTSVLSGQIALDRLSRELQMAFNERLQGDTAVFKSVDKLRGPDLKFSYFDSPLKVLFIRRTPGLKVVRYWLEKESGQSALVRLLRSEGPIYDHENL